MGAGINEWTVYIQDGQVCVGELDDLEDYPNLAKVSNHMSDEVAAKSAAFDFATKSGLPIFREESQEYIKLKKEFSDMEDEIKRRRENKSSPFDDY